MKEKRQENALESLQTLFELESEVLPTYQKIIREFQAKSEKTTTEKLNWISLHREGIIHSAQVHQEGATLKRVKEIIRKMVPWKRQYAMGDLFRPTYGTGTVGYNTICSLSKRQS